MHRNSHRPGAWRARAARLAWACTCLLAAGAVRAQDRPARALDPALIPYAPQPVQVDPAAGYLDADGAVRIGGAEHVQFIVERFNALFARHHPGIRFAVDGKGTTSAVPLLMFGRTMFGAMGRAINPIERVPYQKVVGADPVELAVAHTADDTSGGLATTLAVYVNRANPLERLSMKQLSQVLAIGNPEGDYSAWGQLGLTGEWRRRAIHPVGTPAYTGFGDYLQETHLHRRLLAPAYEEASNSETILRRIGDDPAAVGVAAIGLENARVRQLALADGQGAPALGSDAEVASGAYPLGRSLYFYVRRVPGKPLDPLVREYMRLVLSREGQAIIASQPRGYIPLTAAQASTQLRKLDIAD